ncbi:GIDE domain-containing protein [Haloarchaeobius amylolyticus]|uniref:GIDE domain-containing protein n=1 Tax=Haloarchaeobius amylolyticus TaxID=1198296 RepID=UPI00226D5B94|nr:GIDE domain-containing protein [Haloarchaeobius amylolyticus]
MVLGLSTFGLLASLAGFALVGYGGLAARDAYRIHANDPKSAYEARNSGPFEIEGTAKPHEEYVRSPFTDTQCLACRWKVEEYRTSGKNSHWATVDEGTWWRPFRVEDDTGQVLVDPQGARFSLEESSRIEVDGGTMPPEQVQQFIDANEAVDSENTSVDLKLFRLKTGNDRRYVEERLDVGETVHVLGHSRPDPDREFGSRLYAIVGAPQRLDSGPLGNLLARLLEPPFLVSDTTERGAVRRLAFRAVVPLAIGVACLGFALVLL